ncbi:MAG: SUMF1/EgtB/PvdO family nonheme iron enzyme [Planctomycetes bacterium]|nr:SUMF1/EgtB/PvdO family nonheme iron enzyme [Planctomycetota bacterium]
MAGCGADRATPEPTAESSRSDRFGILRDLVLIDRPPAKGGPFFLDRFETTVGDYLAYLRAHPGASIASHLADTDPRLPVTRIDLLAARAYAAWRFCRLPREDEWVYACTQGGAYRYPWGDQFSSVWCNAGNLGLGRRLPVGTFESGRSPGGPYDLIGNVAEWTEAVHHPMLREQAAGESAEMPGLAAFERTPGLSCWLPGWLPAPTDWLVQADDHELARVALGGSFLSRINPNRLGHAFPTDEYWLPRSHAPTLGVRLAADAEGLLRSMAELVDEPSRAADHAVLRFVRHAVHRPLLKRAWRRVAATAARGPLWNVLNRELAE